MPGFASLYFVDFSSMTFCKGPLRAFPAFGTSSTLAFHARVAESKSAVSFFFSARDAAMVLPAGRPPIGFESRH
jgi:hypothetical protein